MRAIPSRKLDKKITRVWRLSALINVLIWSAICIAPVGIPAAVMGGSTSKSDLAIAYGLTIATIILLVLAALFFIIFVVIVPKIRWIQWSFDVLDEEIDIHKGIFWHTRLIIPLIRVQNVETHQGPVMRAHGLASLKVATAAGEHEIPGLAVAEADALRDQVAVLARIAQEDV